MYISYSKEGKFFPEHIHERNTNCTAVPYYFNGTQYSKKVNPFHKINRLNKFISKFQWMALFCLEFDQTISMFT